MLTLTPSQRAYRIIGIDPGTDTLGVAVLDLDLLNGQISLVEARTFDGTQLARPYSAIAGVHGDRQARLLAHEDNLYGYFNYIQPHSVIAESPFMRKFPAAYAALTECIVHIRRGLMRYDAFMALHMVDPPTAKKAVGAVAKGSNKDGVKTAILKLPTLLNPYRIDIAALDEHSIDAIAVGYVRAQELASKI